MSGSIENQIRRKIIDSIHEEMRWREKIEIHDSSELSELGIDSLKVITIIFRLEDDLKIEVPNSAIESCKKFEDVLKLIVSIKGVNNG